MTDQNHDEDTVDFYLPIPGGVSIGHAMLNGPHMNNLFIRGGREQAEKLAMALLAELTGDAELFGFLEFRELRMALLTLGEIGSYGLDEDLAGELSEPQNAVVSSLGVHHQLRMETEGMGE